MNPPRILLALHRPGSGDGLADGLAARGLPTQVTRNMAATWVALRQDPPDAVLLAPITRDTSSAEFDSLLRRAAAPGGPAVLVLTDGPDFLEGHVDDFLPDDVGPDAAARRIRFAVARRAALARLRGEREQLRRQSFTDFKTGLFNDRCFSERTREEVARARRTGQPLGVLVIDFDGFKAINDVHGHNFGDRALASFARCLRRNLREFDVAARIGGDEFSVLLPATSLSDTIGIAERLRAAVAGLVVQHEGRRAALSISIGAGAWSPSAGGRFEDVMHGADDALLAAKQAGRGRVGVHEAGGPRVRGASTGD